MSCKIEISGLCSYLASAFIILFLGTVSLAGNGRGEALIRIGSTDLEGAGHRDQENGGKNKKDKKDDEKRKKEREKRELKAVTEYDHLRHQARARLADDDFFRIRVDETYKELRRQHSEIAFRINTFDSNDERVTFTGDKLKTEDSLYDNPFVQDYVNRVGQSLVPEKSRIRYAFKVVLNPVPDARTYSTGTVYITSGLLSIIDNEAQLAYILGHEIGHSEKNHWYEDALVSNQIEDLNQKKEEKQRLFTGTIGIVAGALSGLTGQGVAGALFSANSAMSLAAPLMKFLNPNKVFIWDLVQENEADRFGFDLMFARNYDPREVPKLYHRLRKFAEDEPRTGDGFLAQVARIGQRSDFMDSVILGTIVKPNLFRGAMNLREKRETVDTGLVSPLEAGKTFGTREEATAREAKAVSKLNESETLLREKLSRGEIIGSGPEFLLVMADLKRDNGIRAFYYDMFKMAIENLKESIELRSNDPYTYYYYGKVLRLTAHTPNERAESMKAFIRSIELDQRRIISGPWLHRALTLMADQNQTQSNEIISHLKNYVEVYQQEHGGDLPPNMDAIYAYLKELGDEKWVARPVVNISTRNIDPIQTVSTPVSRPDQGNQESIPSTPDPRPTPSDNNGKRVPNKRRNK